MRPLKKGDDIFDELYDEWAHEHALAFALNDAELRAVLSWKEVFFVSGYTLENLRDATKHLIANPGKLAALAFAGKMPAHLASIQARIREAIAVVHDSEREKAQDRGSCTRCGGSGSVSVPHLKGIKDGEWVPQGIARGGASYYTTAVRCNCALGNWLKERMTDAEKNQMLGLNRYAQLNPRWEIQLEKRKQRQLKLAEISAREKANDPDAQRLGDSMAALLKKHGLELPDYIKPTPKRPTGLKVWEEKDTTDGQESTP